jgi:hypothetical protein
MFVNDRIVASTATPNSEVYQIMIAFLFATRNYYMKWSFLTDDSKAKFFLFDRDSTEFTGELRECSSTDYSIC